MGSVDRGYVIREANAEDLPGIDAIYNAEILTGVATWDLEPWSPERRRRWFEEHRTDPTQPVLVAEAAGEVVGFASLSKVSEKGGWRFTREDTVYVRTDWQGRGVGRALLEALIERARELPVRLIVASIESTNERSLALHRSLGFELIGEYRHAGFKFGAWRSTTYLGLDLGDPRERGAPFA
jgi:phosphinothricin acetyltransferase